MPSSARSRTGHVVRHDADEVDALALPQPARADDANRRDELARPEAAARAEVDEPRLLARARGVTPLGRSPRRRRRRRASPRSVDPKSANRMSRTRSRSSTRSARTAGRGSGSSSSHSSARNQRSRSAYGTAAFAGDVDGSTKSPSSPSVRSCGPSSGRSRKAPRYASLPTNAIAAGRSSRAMPPSRSAEPAKSALRRSPEPFVVRSAAFVRPMPKPGSSNCSCGSSRRGVKPASWSSRQKSLRGFAKWAAAAAETRPGLIPQKTTLRFGASTSGTEQPLRRRGTPPILPRPSPTLLLLRERPVRRVLRPLREELHDLLSQEPTAGTLGIESRSTATVDSRSP